MSYEQTLWKEVKDLINPKILKKQNRFKKWEYGYNSDYDFIVISKTGQIGPVSYTHLTLPTTPYV